MKFTLCFTLIYIFTNQLSSTTISNIIYDAQDPEHRNMGDDGGRDGKHGRADTMEEPSPKLYSIDLEEKQLLCARVKCLETEFCIVKDHMVACVKIEELFHSNHSRANTMVQDKRGPGQRSTNGAYHTLPSNVVAPNDPISGFDLRGLESVCIPCPPGIPRDFVCGTDGRTYASPCQLSYESCLQHSQIILTLPALSSQEHKPLEIECEGFCPCPQTKTKLNTVYPDIPRLSTNLTTTSTFLPPPFQLREREPHGSYEERDLPQTYSEARRKLLGNDPRKDAAANRSSTEEDTPTSVPTIVVVDKKYPPETSVVSSAHMSGTEAKKKRYWAVLLRERDRIASMLRNSFPSSSHKLNPVNQSKSEGPANGPSHARFYRGDHVAVPSIVDRFAPPLVEDPITIPATSGPLVSECTHAGMLDMKDRLLHWFDSLADTEMRDAVHSTPKRPYQLEPMECSEDDGTGRPLHQTWWMFGSLDVNGDRYLDISELRHLEAPYMNAVEPCFKPFLDNCDSNQDTLLSTFEWCSCFRDTRKPCFTAKVKVNPSLRKSYIPLCDDSGFFKPEQCHDKTCWCVTPDGDVIPHSTMVASKDTFRCHETGHRNTK